MSDQTTNSNIKAIAFMAAAGAAVVLLFVMVYVPQLKKFLGLQREFYSARHEITRAEEKITSSVDIVTDLVRLEKELAELESRMVREDEIAFAVEALETVAFELEIASGIMIQPLDEMVAAQEEAAEARRLSFRIELECTFERLVEYLASLRSLPMLVAVEDVRVESANVEGRKLQTELRVCTYTLQ